MLILSRKCREQVILETSDGTITVTLIENAGKKVRLGFEAPPDVVIYRSELYENNKGEQDERKNYAFTIG